MHNTANVGTFIRVAYDVTFVELFARTKKTDQQRLSDQYQSVYHDCQQKKFKVGS